MRLEKLCKIRFYIFFFIFPIQQIIRHNYSMTFKTNDIALIELAKGIVLDTNIWPACLETSVNDLDSTEQLTVTGWGSTSAERKNFHQQN